MRTAVLSFLCIGVLLAIGADPVLGQSKPGPEHEVLKKFEGQWDAIVKFGGMEMKGSSDNKVGLGGFWLQSNFKSQFGTEPFEGRGVMGYDPVKKKYVSTWIDSMTPTMTISEGTFDKVGKVYTELGEGVGPEMKLQKMKSVHEFKDQDNMVLTMYNIVDGKDQLLMEIIYKRKK